MPSKFLLRNFTAQGTYHIFNRGIDKRQIFIDTEDYNLFLYYLYIYLTPIDKVLRRYHHLPQRLFNKNLAKHVDILAYCFMPNHYHLIVKQRGKIGISQLMKQVSNAYTQYFNNKYKRSGSLFEGPFKSVAIDGSDQLRYLTRYLHVHPIEGKEKDAAGYEWSSYHEYIDDGVWKFCRLKPVLAHFPSIYSYKKFVHDEKDFKKKFESIRAIVFE